MRGIQLIEATMCSRCCREADVVGGFEFQDKDSIRLRLRAKCTNLPLDPGCISLKHGFNGPTCRRGADKLWLIRKKDPLGLLGCR